MPQPRWSSEPRGRSAMARCRADGPRTHLRQAALGQVERRRLIT